MKFLAILGLAGAAIAQTGTGAVYTTVTATAYTTICPQPTSFEFNHKTYTATESCTLTITDCPDHACTWVQPVYTSTAVHCGDHGCGGGYGNYSAPHPTVSPVPTGGCSGYSCHTGGDEEEELEVVEAGAGRVVAFSGAALAGVIALAAAL